MDELKLRGPSIRLATPKELRREGSVFLVGGELPPRPSLETLFESHCISPAELFHLSFGAPETFPQGEELARLIKKNFTAHLVGRIDYPLSPSQVERAYAAGIDIIDIPLGSGTEDDRKERLASLEYAREIFPRWAVASTLPVGDAPAGATIAAIDDLLNRRIVPLPEVPLPTAADGRDDTGTILRHLVAAWRRHRVAIAPLQPLIVLTTPLVPARPDGILRGFIDRLRDRQLLAAADLRRTLRVRQVEESFESAGL
ncbi:hypothetical protein [Geobacter pickeringii]|uniref:hypothetical protein n=1 Tax=Geobacter pickeringii TaxID=345632 RepID=UPI001F2CA116|nr:hypothetical protein [Geobacter pickeringii]